MNKPPYTVNNPMCSLSKVGDPPTRTKKFVSLEVAKGLYDALEAIIERNDNGEIEEFDANALMDYESFKKIKAAMEAAEEKPL